MFGSGVIGNAILENGHGPKGHWAKPPPQKSALDRWPMEVPGGQMVLTLRQLRPNRFRIHRR